MVTDQIEAEEVEEDHSVKEVAKGASEVVIKQKKVK